MPRLYPRLATSISYDRVIAAKGARELLVWIVIAAAVGGVIWLDPLSKLQATHAVDAGVTLPPIADAAGTVIVAPDAAIEIDAAVATLSPPLYTVAEAFDDIAADPLVFIGTGEWFGNFSIHGCAYRNSRVIVVNVYCTVREQPALSIVVLSPTRGRLEIYAEGGSAASLLARVDYISFRLDAEPPPSEPLTLDMTYADLRAWDERRYNAHVPGCWSGEGDACTPGAEAQLAAWDPSAVAFLAAPPAAYFKLAKDLHVRATRDSRRAKP